MSGLRSRLAMLERKVAALPVASPDPPVPELGPDYIPLSEWTDEELAERIALLEQNPESPPPIPPALRRGAVRPPKPAEPPKPAKIPLNELSDEQLRWLIYTHERSAQAQDHPPSVIYTPSTYPSGYTLEKVPLEARFPPPEPPPWLDDLLVNQGMAHMRQYLNRLADGGAMEAGEPGEIPASNPELPVPSGGA